MVNRTSRFGRLAFRALIALPAILATLGVAAQTAAQHAPVANAEYVTRHPILNAIHLASPPALDGPQRVLSGHIPQQVAHSAHIGLADPGANLQLTVMLQPHDRAAMDELAHRVNDPRDPLFGHYLTPAQRIARFSPSQEELMRVAYVLQRKGLRITDVSTDRISINVTGTTAQVANAFGVQIHTYQDATGRRFHAPDRDPALPASIAPLVLGINGLDDAALVRPMHQSVVIPHNNSAASRSGKGNGVGKHSDVTLAGQILAGEIRNMYRIGISPINGTKINGAGQTIALLETQGYNQSDIDNYISNNKSSLIPISLNTIPIKTIYTNGTDSSVGTETELDIEMLEAIADGLNGSDGATGILLYDTNSGSLNGGLTRIVNDNKAHIVSISYGSDETSSSIDNTWELITENAVLQGQAIYVSSGDSGSAGPYSGTGTIINAYCSSRWVTAVGGTSITLDSSLPPKYSSETAWKKSGGGISKYVSIPDYQSYYLNLFPGSLASPASTGYRNVPDVALNADPHTGYYAYINGSDSGKEGGTSAAAPLWAGFHAILNQVRLLNNYPVIGFLNYALYQDAEGPNYNSDFHDINDGSSNGAYTTVTGYDCVTGLGSFVGVNLLTDLVSPFAGSPISSIMGTETVVRGASGAFTVALSQPVPAKGFAVITLYRVGSTVSQGRGTVAAGQASIVIPFVAPLDTQTQYEYYYATYQYSDGSEYGPVIGQSPERPVLVIASNGLAAVTTDNSTIALGQSVNCKLILSGPVTKDELVYIDAENTAWLSVPTSVTVPNGASSATFTATSLIPNAYLLQNAHFPLSYHIWAHAPDGSDLGPNHPSAVLKIQKNPLGGLYPAANYVAGSSAGKPFTVQLTAIAAAPAGGMTVKLSSSSPGVTVPASVTIHAGQTYANFNATAFPVTTATPVTLTAVYHDPTGVMSDSSVSATVTVEPPATLVSMTFPSNYFISGQYLTGTLTLSSPVTATTTVHVTATPQYSLASSADVTFLTGQSQNTFRIGDATFFLPDPIVVTATLGSVTLSQTVSAVSAVAVSSLIIQPGTVTVGGQATGTVSLYAPATVGSGGYDVSLTTDKAGVTIPKTVHIAERQSSATFTIKGNTNISKVTTVNISANTTSTAVTTPITVTPPNLTGLTLSANSVAGGSSITGTVTLASTVSVATPVSLSCGDPSAKVPSVVNVPAGASSGTFTVSTNSVPAPTAATITASLSGVSQSQTLQVLPPVIAKFTLGASTVKSGNKVTCTVTLSSKAPAGGYLVGLASTSTAVPTPKTVTVPANSTTLTFTLVTTKVTGQKIVILTASSLSNLVPATLILTP